jgi:hypothetical protein
VRSVPTSGRSVGRCYRLRRVLVEAGSVVLGVILLIWSLAPVSVEIAGILRKALKALPKDAAELESQQDLGPPRASIRVSSSAVLTSFASAIGVRHFLPRGCFPLG